MNAYRHTELDYRTLILGNLSLLEWDYSLSWGDVPHPSRLLPADGLVNSIRALHFWHTKQGCAGPLRAQGNIASPKGAEGRKNYRWREMWPVTCSCTIHELRMGFAFELWIRKCLYLTKENAILFLHRCILQKIYSIIVKVPGLSSAKKPLFI